MANGLTFECVRCGRELEEPGGLLFSPQWEEWGDGTCLKEHLCRGCYKDIRKAWA